MSLNFIKPSLEKNKKSDVTILSHLAESIETSQFSILGYPDDEGISLNGGKVGAAKAPSVIRNLFYKMTPHKDHFKNKLIFDHGDLNFEGSEIKDRHEFASSKVLDLLSKNKKVIALGGGHDYGYVDGKAFCESQNDKALIFNFDAHFDLRNLEKGLSSGTPFYRLKETYKEKLQLFELGIQKHCNSQTLFDYASANNIQTLLYDELYPDHKFNFEHFKNQIDSNTIAHQDCYISVDIDGFASSIASGCSQSWPVGFDIEGFFLMFEHLVKRFNVRVLGVYEVSPPLDHNFMTSRLAALIIYRFIELCKI